jgi:glycosyltransferase involved in cell wall biosynthesis
MPARKLLVVSDEMEVGGSQRQIAYLLGGIDRTRWQPELLFFRNPSHLVDELRAQGIVVHHLPKQGRLDPGFVLAYASLLRRQRYDLVHAFSLTAELWTLVARLLAWSAPKPLLVSSVRGLYLTEPDWFWRIKRRIFKGSAAIIANAKAGAAAAASRSGVPRERFDVIPNGILPIAPLAEEQRQALRASLDLPAGRTLGLFVGRLVVQKNVPCLLRAMSRLPAAARPYLVMAGDGPLRSEIEAQRLQLNLQDDVHLLGERTDARKLMGAADFLVLPSAYEGMSNVVMEGMASGCPVVASDVGGNPELVEDGLTGLLFPNDDDAALAQCLERLTADPALRSRLSAQALQRMQTRYSVESLVTSTMAVYDRCLLPAHARLARAPAPTASNSGETE